MQELLRLGRNHAPYMRNNVTCYYVVSVHCVSEDYGAAAVRSGSTVVIYIGLWAW